MRRRDLLALAAGTAIVPRLVCAQKKLPIVGFLHSLSAERSTAVVGAFQEALAEAGYLEGRNVTIEYRWAEGVYERLPALAADLVDRKVDAIVMGGGTVSAVAANEAVGISIQDLDLWKRKHPEFLEAIANGKILADANMAERLYLRGLGYSHEAVKIFMPAGAEAPVYAPYTQHYPPDTQAASLWLRNRQPRLWRDKREVELQGALEHRIAQMTPEQRRERLRELTERALTIDHDEHEFE